MHIHAHFFRFNPCGPTFFLTVAKMSLSNHSEPYSSNPPFLFYDIRALWRSVLSARVPECHKIENDGLDQYRPETVKCSHLASLGFKGLGLIVIFKLTGPCYINGSSDMKASYQTS